VLVLFLEPAGLPSFLTTMRRKGVNLTKKGVNLKFSKIWQTFPKTKNVPIIVFKETTTFVRKKHWFHFSIVHVLGGEMSIQD